ncbi:MAG: cell division protein FtsA [Candidatus Paceibacterota bacterium]|jgi:cell division protein FtsA
MYITSLDLGTSQIKILVSELTKDGQLNIRGVFKSPSAGIRKGEIADPNDAAHALRQSFSALRHFHKSVLNNIFVNVGGTSVKMCHSRGIVAVSRADYEIREDDVARVVEASRAINLSPNREILHTITKEFIIDGVSNIKEPLGMTGNRLEVNSLIIDVFSPAVKNLNKLMELAGGNIGGLVYNPIASSRSILTKSQKDLGVALIDIGFSTTSLSVWEEDNLLQLKVFPIGSSHITNDLAIGLKSSIEAAEIIKLSFGCALPKGVPSREMINLNDINEDLKGTVSKRFIAEIIESRLSEIFELINEELKQISKAGQLPAGVVLVGNGAKLPGIVELAKQELKLPSQIGIPQLTEIEISNNEVSNQIEDPEFAVGLGLLLCAKDQQQNLKGLRIGGRSFISKIFKPFLP